MGANMKINRVLGLKGQVAVPGDKSISHRSVMLGAIAKGRTEISHFLQGADCLSTISCFQQMGIQVENQGNLVIVHGNGLYGLKKPSAMLDCGNSGTTLRLMSGILAGQSFDSSLTGDSSIQKRPMKRIMEPLSLMGASMSSIRDNGCAPMEIKGRRLHGIQYSSPVASAQVKSAILLAGLYAEGETWVREPYLSRNHSELMLKQFGAKVEWEGAQATIHPPKQLYGQKIQVPGDISSAAYFMAAALMVPNSQVLIKNVGTNPTRDGILRVCQAMGGKVECLAVTKGDGEPAADLLVSSSHLHGTTIEGGIIPALIDELPIIAAMAAMAEGVTVIKDAGELKVKESNRIHGMVKNLSAMGAQVEETEDGMVIHGGRKLKGAVIDSQMDHRMAMTFAVLGLCADGETEVLGGECVDISYPGFWGDLRGLTLPNPNLN